MVRLFEALEKSDDAALAKLKSYAVTQLNTLSKLKGTKVTKANWQHRHYNPIPSWLIHSFHSILCASCVNHHKIQLLFKRRMR